jgi:hypothetical protein
MMQVFLSEQKSFVLIGGETGLPESREINESEFFRLHDLIMVVCKLRYAATNLVHLSE